ncbi:MAG: myxococcus cysteine-rich repeat containing protein [bacterium]|nr:myxococcus cysteine-rich repeat containing protein [bacterium]
MVSKLKFLVAVLLMIGLGLPMSMVAAPAPDAVSVLILDSTVSGGALSREAVLAAANGFTVVVDSAAAWGARTMAEFATFRAIILGDATCTGVGAVAAAEANKAVWGPAIDGNVIINGTDPVFHQGQGGDALTEGSIKFAADEPTKTGAYISLSCYYAGAASGTPAPVLDPFGSFTVVGQGGCPADSHIVAVHPALAGITDASLSNWGCSTHNGFVTYPADFLVLAISEDIPSTYVAPDGSTGAPYILARGETLSPILCGNGILEMTEECDDGNVVNGDGCSAQCKIEVYVPACGNGILDSGEQCDDGNLLNGDGCSDVCKFENQDPDCKSAYPDPATLWPPNHKYVTVSVLGVTDPDGDAVVVMVNSVTQDEPVNGLGDGDTSPDAVINSDGTVKVRAERSGTPKVPGDGRVYHIGFMAEDGMGGKCAGTVLVCVPHDMGQGSVCVDGGPLYDSLMP